MQWKQLDLNVLPKETLTDKESRIQTDNPSGIGQQIYPSEPQSLQFIEGIDQ